MADVWIGYSTILETVMARMNQLCLHDRDRSASFIHEPFSVQHSNINLSNFGTVSACKQGSLQQ